ncbi:hypothetical protein B0H14DRAFT_2618201 [Mycena olivaceomarginata]|nr:hypothetical protein B0H14DRAFT_2618201 [Mycena olivaceomarginata]
MAMSPILGPNQYGKLYFIGCSKWHPEKHWLHRYHWIPPNVDEEIFRYVLENKGRVPDGNGVEPQRSVCAVDSPASGAETLCHVLDGVIRPAKLLQRRPYLSELLRMAAGVRILGNPDSLRNGHNHPAHPHIKPSAVMSVSLEQQWMHLGLKISRQAFADVRKIRDRIAAHRKVEFPAGTGFSGSTIQGSALHANQDRALPVSERYIQRQCPRGFQAGGDFAPAARKVHTGVLALAIDYTFKHIEGDMDEWEVVGFSERFKCHKPAFEQLFLELFDTVYRVTGDKLQCLTPLPPLRMRRRRRQSVDENDIVEGIRQRTQSNRARGEAYK